MRRLQLLLLAIGFGALGLLTACSITTEKSAYGSIAADTVITEIGLSAGLSETNPLGWATLPYSIALVEHAKTLPPEQGTPIVHGISAVKWGAALSNLLLIAGAANPVGWIAGGALALKLWQDGQGEREFWAICAAEKITCKFEPFHQAERQI